MSAWKPAAAEPRVAWVAGSSGLTGGALLGRLIEDSTFTRVLALSRRPVRTENARLANRILRFDDLAASLKGQPCTDALCTLGAAGGPRADEAQLRAVDLGLVLAFAKAARAAGATRFTVVSAAGADPKATQPFQRVKGEMEAALRELRFPALDILQPGVVYGSRAQDGLADTARLGMLALASPLLRRTKAHLALSGDQLAAAMVAAVRSQRRGISTYAGESLAAVAHATPRANPTRGLVK